MHLHRLGFSAALFCALFSLSACQRREETPTTPAEIILPPTSAPATSPVRSVPVLPSDLSGEPAPLRAPTEAELSAIEAALPERPSGVGRPITDRAAWGAVQSQNRIQQLVADAAKYAQSPVPTIGDAEWTAIKLTGKREPFEVPYRLRTTRLLAFVIAECVQNEGRYLPAVTAELTALLDERSWCSAAHVHYKPENTWRTDVDLGAANRAWTIATADYLLGDRLPAELRARLRTETRERMLNEYLAAAAEGRARWSWMNGRTNWNAVCTSGVVGAGLTLLESRRERALLVWGLAQSSPFFLSGFSADGMTSEGLGYWVYGFGSYLMAAEALYQSTEGRINFYAHPKIRAIALMARRYEMTDGLYPAFSDSSISQKSDAALDGLINQRYQLGWPGATPRSGDYFATHPLGDRLYSYGLLAFPLPEFGGAHLEPQQEKNSAALAARDFFPDGQVLIARRPASDDLPNFSLAIKGGHNDEPHNHNDNGSFVIGVAGRPLLLDPGMEVYTKDTFGPLRYTSMMMNSLGHSVPVVAGKAQGTGKKFRGEIISTKFTPERDEVVMDLTTSYEVASLQKLTRTFIFDRKNGQVEIVDEANFSRPERFGTALVTCSKWMPRPDGQGARIADALAALDVEWSTASGELVFNDEPVTGLNLPRGVKPVRLVLDFAHGHTPAAQCAARGRESGRRFSPRAFARAEQRGGAIHRRARRRGRTRGPRWGFRTLPAPLESARPRPHVARDCARGWPLRAATPLRARRDRPRRAHPHGGGPCGGRFHFSAHGWLGQVA
jgi:Heparinase II/III-like protein